MTFDISKVYTAVNADELKGNDKVIVADDLSTLRRRVEENNPNMIREILLINPEDMIGRFVIPGLFGANDCVYYNLAYLVERASEMK